MQDTPEMSEVSVKGAYMFENYMKELEMQQKRKTPSGQENETFSEKGTGEFVVTRQVVAPL